VFTALTRALEFPFLLVSPGEVLPHRSQSEKGKLRSHSNGATCSLPRSPSQQHSTPPLPGVPPFPAWAWGWWPRLGSAVGKRKHGEGAHGRSLWPGVPSAHRAGAQAAGLDLAALGLVLGEEQMGSISRDYLEISKGLRHNPLNLDKQT